MIYTWRCTKCKRLTDVERPVAEYDKPPDKKCCRGADWSRAITSAPGVPWTDLRQSGVLMDDNGNYAPRKIDV